MLKWPGGRRKKETVFDLKDEFMLERPGGVDLSSRVNEIKSVIALINVTYAGLKGSPSIDEREALKLSARSAVADFPEDALNRLGFSHDFFWKGMTDARPEIGEIFRKRVQTEPGKIRRQKGFVKGVIASVLFTWDRIKKSPLINETEAVRIAVRSTIADLPDYALALLLMVPNKSQWGSLNGAREVAVEVYSRRISQIGSGKTGERL